LGVRAKTYRRIAGDSSAERREGKDGSNTAAAAPPRKSRRLTAERWGVDFQNMPKQLQLSCRNRPSTCHASFSPQSSECIARTGAKRALRYESLVLRIYHHLPRETPWSKRFSDVTARRAGEGERAMSTLPDWRQEMNTFPARHVRLTGVAIAREFAMTPQCELDKTD